jgi:hypothetical protein
MTEADSREFARLISGERPILGYRRFWLWLAAALPLLAKREKCTCRQSLALFDQEFEFADAHDFRAIRRHAHRNGPQQFDECGLRYVYEAVDLWLQGALLTSECWGKTLDAHYCIRDNWLRSVCSNLQEASTISNAVASHHSLLTEEWNAATACFHDIVDSLLTSPTLAHTWRTSNVTALAQAIYCDRAFDRLPILADALEDAGCDNADILNHCRQPGEHVRGCWVVDLVLGKG